MSKAKIEEVVKPYELRNLKDSDIFPLLSILRKIGMKEFKDSMTQPMTTKDEREHGIAVFMDIATVIVSNIGNAEEEIYDLWSDLSGIPADQIKEMEFGTLPMMIFDTFTEMRNTTFFKVLSKLL